MKKTHTITKTSEQELICRRLDAFIDVVEYAYARHGIQSFGWHDFQMMGDEWVCEVDGKMVNIPTSIEFWNEPEKGMSAWVCNEFINYVEILSRNKCSSREEFVDNIMLAFCEAVSLAKSKIREELRKNESSYRELD